MTGHMPSCRPLQADVLTMLIADTKVLLRWEGSIKLRLLLMSFMAHCKRPSGRLRDLHVNSCASNHSSEADNAECREAEGRALDVKHALPD